MNNALRVLLALLFPLTCLVQAADDTGPNEFTILEAQKIVRYKVASDKDLPARFNGKRPYAISICRNLANTVAVRQDLIVRLDQIRQLDQVVFEWFDVNEVQAFVVDIGNKVPVGIAQAALQAAGNQMKDLPLVLVISTRGEFDDTQRIYLGSRVAIGAKPLSQGKLEALLKPGITRQQFLKIATEKE